jgi:hypothetical protein
LLLFASIAAPEELIAAIFTGAVRAIAIATTMMMAEHAVQRSCDYLKLPSTLPSFAAAADHAEMKTAICTVTASFHAGMVATTFAVTSGTT